MLKNTYDESLVLPDFIIVGAMKSGTSLLSFHLNNHKEICIPYPTEISFFNKDDNYLKGMKWYSDKLRQRYSEKTRLVGEKTAIYSYLPFVPSRIHKELPNVKLVWIFRNPIDRTYSNYLNGIKRGIELSSFKTALKKEPKRLKKSPLAGYTERSRYDIQIKRYLEFFPREQMHFIVLEEFINNPHKELDALFQFLGVSQDAFTYKEEVINKTLMPRFPFSLWVTRSIFGIDSKIWKLVQKVNLLGKKPGYRKLDADMRIYLGKIFKPNNEELEKILGRKIEVWK